MVKYEIFLVTVKGDKARVGSIGELMSVMAPNNVNVLDIGQSGLQLHPICSPRHWPGLRVYLESAGAHTCCICRNTL
jgi:hypothetical protein